MGLTAAVTDFIFRHGGNIIHADQHIDEQSQTFFMRIEWNLDGFDLGRTDIADVFSRLAATFGMTWRLSFSDEPKRLAVFVSRHLHCLDDLLYRHRSGQFNGRICLVISNHDEARTAAQAAGIPFQQLPVTSDNKVQQERTQLELLKEYAIDVVVLARYLQILTPDFVRALPNRIVNIHHSFLPAFPGKNPYARAFAKGVKLIGATCHFVTEELDSGPIIEQDTVRVSHRDHVSDVIRKGKDLERIVLSRALRWLLADKILCYQNKTVVFD